MAISNKHKYVSGKADGGDTSLVRPSNWNDEHDLVLDTGKLVGRTTAGTGAAEEISVSANLSLAAGTLDIGANPAVTTIELGHATDTTLSRVSAGVIAVEGSTIARVSDVTGQQTIWVPAGAMTPTTTNGAASGSTELATNDIMLKYLAFDAATQEKAQVMIQMPKGWDEGTIIAQFVWTHPSTTTNFGVTWGIRAVAFANDDAMDAGFGGTAREVVGTGGTTSDCYITSETSAMTVAGTPGAEELVCFEIYRAATHGSDTLAVDAYLIGVKIHYTTDAAKDD
jgi:hypothetical protein